MPDKGWQATLLAVLALAGAGQALSAGPGQELLAKARVDLARGDGIAAEMRLRQSLEKGAADDDVAALIGRAYLLQGDNVRARQWLSGHAFARADAASGWRALGLLEHQEGHLPAAGKAFDQALSLTPGDAVLWIDIARLRYAGGEHLLAIEAIDKAYGLDDGNPRVLEAKAQLVRDQFGLVASLVWFEAGLARHPDDRGLLDGYAATLGDVGRATEALEVSRHLLGIDPKSADAFLVQAVLAARGGDYVLARALLNRTGASLAKVPAAMLLDGLLQLQSGNGKLATESFEKLLRLQPANPRIQALLAQALFEAGEHKYLVERLAGSASEANASPYLCAVVGRSLELIGKREEAARYLDCAGRKSPGFVQASEQAGDFARMLASGRVAEAADLAERERKATPGNFLSYSRAGDAQLALGHGQEAFKYYRVAARIREPESLFLREIEALSRAEGAAQAVILADQYLARNPSSRVAARLVSGLAAQAKDWPRSRLLLEYLLRTGGSRDPRLWADLAFVSLRSKDMDGAIAAARRAWRLQPSSPHAAGMLGLLLARQGKHREEAAALLAQAKQALGETPVILEGQNALTRSQPAS